MRREAVFFCSAPSTIRSHSDNRLPTKVLFRRNQLSSFFTFSDEKIYLIFEKRDNGRRRVVTLPIVEDATHGNKGERPMDHSGF